MTAPHAKRVEEHIGNTCASNDLSTRQDTSLLFYPPPVSPSLSHLLPLSLCTLTQTHTHARRHDAHRKARTWSGIWGMVAPPAFRTSIVCVSFASSTAVPSAWIYKSIHVCVCVRVCVCVYIYTYTYLYVYMCTHTPTHIVRERERKIYLYCTFALITKP
jgi:hypothetical protein